MITACWGIFVEETRRALVDFEKIHRLVKILNIGSATISGIMGIDTAVASLPEQANCSVSYFTTVDIMLFAGLNVFFASLFTRPTCTSLVQLVPFVIVFFSGLWNFSFGNDGHTELNTPWGCEASVDSTDNFNVNILSDAESGSRPFELAEYAYHHRLPLQAHTPILPKTPLFRSRALKDFLAFDLVVWSFSFLLIALGTLGNLNYMESMPSPHQSARLDVSLHPSADFDIVISMYKEDPLMVKALVTRLQEIPNIANRSTRLVIYTKDEDADVATLKSQIGATEIVPLRNVGRESETYLHHIISKWDNLATHTLFVQAHVHNPWEFFHRIDHYFTSNTGMLSLGFVGNVCDCLDCRDRWGWQDSDIMPGIFREVYNTTTCATILLSYKGQFIASARRIRGISRRPYEYLHNALANPESWAHKERYLRGRPDSMNAPLLGYTVERLWSVLMQCSDMNVAQKCASLLSRTRRGGSLGDCQCHDNTG